MHGPGRPVRQGISTWKALLTLASKDPSYVVLVPVSGTSTFLSWTHTILCCVKDNSGNDDSTTDSHNY